MTAHCKLDTGNELRYSMSAIERQNEINFGNREMQKTAYYNPTPPYHHQYYPNENGYNYDNSTPQTFGQPTPSPPGSDYYPQSACAVQNTHQTSPGEFSPPPQYGADEFSNRCIQNPNMTLGPGNAQANPTSSILNKKEIYPWMKESRQNSKQRQVTGEYDF